MWDETTTAARRLGSALGMAAMVAALLAIPRGGEAQSIEGRVFETGSRRAVASALIRLVDANGEHQAATAADSTGRYRLTAPAPGEYRLRAELVGYERHETDLFVIRDSAAVLQRNLELRPAPIPVQGVEVTADRQNRRLQAFLGLAPDRLRIRPIRPTTIMEHWRLGNGLDGLIDGLQIPSVEVIPSRNGPCYRFRRQGCLPVYLDGVRVTGASVSRMPLEMLNTIVVLLPNETVAYPQGAVHLFSSAFMRVR